MDREDRDQKIKRQNRFIFELLVNILVSLITTIFVLKTGGVV